MVVKAGVSSDKSSGDVALSREIVHELLVRSHWQRLGLKEVYALLPHTRCGRRTLCCSLLPEVTLVETLAVIMQLAGMAAPMRVRLTRSLVRYFLVNAVEISCCPFLEGRDCLIYGDRFFGCRAYGMWSRPHYEKLAARSRQAKEYNREQWQNLGVLLPREVVEFQVPYCPHVEVVEGEIVPEDEMLLHAAELIEALSQQLGPWHESFRTRYFADLSFLFTSLIFGFPEAVQMKFSLVRDVVATGNRTRIAEILEEVPDLCGELREVATDNDRKGG